MLYEPSSALLTRDYARQGPLNGYKKPTKWSSTIWSSRSIHHSLKLHARCNSRTLLHLTSLESPATMSAQEEQIPIQDESVEETNVDAQAEDEVAASGSDQKQLQAEASELDESNIIDNSPGVTTRGAKVDATKQVSLFRLHLACLHPVLSHAWEHLLTATISFVLRRTGARNRPGR